MQQSGKRQSGFQSTPSVWRETNGQLRRLSTPPISIHSLRVEGDTTFLRASPLQPCISIHSLRVEGDPEHGAKPLSTAPFQSTPSVWRETAIFTRFKAHICISIHSLRVEGDMETSLQTWDYLDFNPLPPCGGRPRPAEGVELKNKFQSTPSVWRETALPAATSEEGVDISIHSLRVEGDSLRQRGI